MEPGGVNDTRRSRRSDAEKLDLAFTYIRTELRWSVSDFVKALAFSEGPANARRKAAFGAAVYKDPEVLKSYIGNANQLQADARQSVIDTLDLGNNELRKEVERLGSVAPFNKYDPTLNGGFDRPNMNQVIRTIQEEAPLLLQLVRNIMAPLYQEKYERQDEPVARIVTIISIFCFSQRQNTCTNLQTTLGLYLHSKDVKSRQLELLNRLGITVSYRTVIRVIKEQSVRAAAQVREMGQGDSSVTAYDNFEVMEGVKEQRVDHQGTFHSVTTGQVIRGIEMPPGGLQQNMLNPKVALCLDDIFLAPGNLNDDVHHQVRISSYPWPT